MTPNPDKVYAPQLANLFQKFCELVRKESGATTIRVAATFVYKKGRGDLKLKTFVTPDSKTERLLNPDVIMPRGSKLQQEATQRLRRQLKNITKLGGK